MTVNTRRTGLAEKDMETVENRPWFGEIGRCTVTRISKAPWIIVRTSGKQ